MKFQCAVYFIIIYTIVPSDASDVQTIKIPINNIDEEYLVQLQKPLKIVFERTYITRCVWNSRYENIVVIEKSIAANSDPSTGFSWLRIPSVTKDMSTEWKCMTKDKTIIIFNIRVKGAYAVEVDLVGTIISFKMTNQSVKEYDGIYNYACEVGDTIDITCRNSYDDGHIRGILQYHDSQGAKYHRSSEKEKFGLTFRMLVRGENVNRLYVDCTYVTPIHTLEQQFTYRTTFQITNRNPRGSERLSKALEIISIVIGSLLAVMSVYCFWRLIKRIQVTQEKQLSRSNGEDYNRLNESTDQTKSQRNEWIEYNDNTHPDALNADQDCSAPISAPTHPPRSTLPSKNTRFQKPPPGCTNHREMEQCRCSTNQRSSLEYDYVYRVKKTCPCVAPSNHLQRNGRAVVPHQVPTHQ